MDGNKDSKKMPELLDLPNEILQQVFEDLRWVADDFYDIESFPFCCKTLMAIVENSITEHKLWKGLYSFIAIHMPETRTIIDAPFTSFHPAILLRELLDDPRKMIYPRTIRAEGIDPDESHQSDDEKEKVARKKPKS